jgi:outer membrane protein assembly factor BamB
MKRSYRFFSRRGVVLLPALWLAALQMCWISTARAADWTWLPGPHGDFSSDETGLLDGFPEDGPEIVWRSQATPAFSGVSVGGGRVFVIGVAKGGEMKKRNDGSYLHIPYKFTGTVDVLIHALDVADGKEIWRHSITMPATFPVLNWEARGPEPEPAVTWANYYGPKSAPTVDGKLIYALLHDGSLHCLEAETGKPVWSKNPRVENKGVTGRFGYSASPLIIDKMVVVPVYAPDFCLAAFDKNTGDLVWKGGTMGDPELKQKRCDGYSTPIVAELEGKSRILFFTGGGLQALDPQDGKLLWNFVHPGGTGEIVPPPVARGNEIFFGSQYCPQSVLLRVENGQPVVVRKDRALRNHFSQIVETGGHLYGSNGNYIGSDFRCVDWKTGAEKWSVTFVNGAESKQREMARVLVADGKLIVLTAYGELILAKPDPTEFKVLGRARLSPNDSDFKFWSPVALSDGQFYCQDTNGEVICVNLKQ